MVTKDEFKEWLHNPVTKMFKEYIEEQMDEAGRTLMRDAGLNPLADRELVGGVAACTEMLDWKPEFFEDDVN